MDNKIIENRKFIKRVFNSDASILIFPNKYMRDQIVKFKDRNNIFLVLSRNANKKYENRRTKTGNHWIFELKLDIKLYSEFNQVQSISTEKTVDLEYLLKDPETNMETLPINETDNIILDLIDLELFDLENYYKLFNKRDFINQSVFDGLANEYWKQNFFLGLVFECKIFCKSESDFGSDNFQEYCYANSSYFGFKKNKVFSYMIVPSDYGEDYKGIKFLNEIFEYFYDGKEFVLMNFDNMPMKFLGKIFYENRGHSLNDKIYQLPEDFLDKTYILSNQMLNYLK